MFEEKRALRIPGPTPVPTSAVRAMSRPMMGHRTKEFSALLERVTKRLKMVVGTDSDVFITASSGTGAMEAAVANTINPGDKVIVLVAGKFGERWVELCRTFGAEVVQLGTEPGRAIAPAAVAELLSVNPDTKAVFATHNETSTGVQNDIKAIAGIVRSTSAIFAVDAVSSLGAIEIRMDEWGIDIVASGSQKALMLPPGLGVIAVSEKAWRAVSECRSPRYYFDLIACRKNMKDTTTPFTPAVSLFYGLDDTTKLIEDEGLDRIYSRHIDMKNMVRAAVRAIGLELLAPDSDASNTITAIKGDGTFDVEKLRKLLFSKYGIEVAGGQGELKGVIFRIGHMGYMDRMDMISTMAAVELALYDLGFRFQMGAGVKAAMEVMAGCEY